MANSRILLVEDDQDIATTVVYHLDDSGFVVEHVSSGEAALTAISETKPDLLVLDIMLPGISGTEVCRRVRSTEATKDLPILIVSARGDEVDRVVGFELGADDYLVKPYSMRELVLRVKSLLRRRGSKSPVAGTIVVGALKVDADSHRVWVLDREIYLTSLEFQLLTALVTQAGRVQSREKLLSQIWGEQEDITSRTVDTHIARLRRKLGAAQDQIETLRGVGYRFQDSPTPTDASCIG